MGHTWGVRLAIWRRPAGLSRLALERDARGVRFVETEGSGDASLDRAFARLARFDRDRPGDVEALLRVWRETCKRPTGGRVAQDAARERRAVGLGMPDKYTLRTCPTERAAR
ncbi:MAG: hypothetical protein K8H88_13465 [Sandaracinaceae bacterium]|nr:hypothetical protein [Sandaracinaceae bacterium]